MIGELFYLCVMFNKHLKPCKMVRNQQSATKQEKQSIPKEAKANKCKSTVCLKNRKISKEKWFIEVNLGVFNF